MEEWRLVGDRLTRRWAAVPGDEPATDLGLSEAA
jgi:hypothetical protein